MDKYYKYVGKKIREARNEHKYTQQYVADMLGIGRSIYSQYERGACSISMKMWLRIAAFLEMDAYKIMEEASKFEKNNS